MLVFVELTKNFKKKNRIYKKKDVQRCREPISVYKSERQEEKSNKNFFFHHTISLTS